MLTIDTKSVISVNMKCVDVISRWGLGDLAKALGLPAKNVRRWVDSDSIPAEWFAAIARAAEKRGFHDITVEALAEIAERRRLSRAQAEAQAA